MKFSGDRTILLDMESVGIFQAKTHFSELVERASRGEVIEITKHGKPVAQLTAPVDGAQHRRDVEEAIATIRDIRTRSKIKPDEVKSLIEEGRRY